MLMRIQSILAVYVYGRIFIKKPLNSIWPLFVDRIHMSLGYLPLLVCRLLSLLFNQMFKQRSHGSYILRIRQDWEWWLNYSYNLLVELIESYTLPLFELVYMCFYCLCLCETIAVVEKNWTVFYIFLIWFTMAFGVTALKVLCFLCSSCKVIGNHGLFSYSRYNLLRIAIKTGL